MDPSEVPELKLDFVDSLLAIPQDDGLLGGKGELKVHLNMLNKQLTGQNEITRDLLPSGRHSLDAEVVYMHSKRDPRHSTLNQA